jgi:hypothetical protein
MRALLLLAWLVAVPAPSIQSVTLRAVSREQFRVDLSWRPPAGATAEYRYAWRTVLGSQQQRDTTAGTSATVTLPRLQGVTYYWACVASVTPAGTSPEACRAMGLPQVDSVTIRYYHGMETYDLAARNDHITIASEAEVGVARPCGYSWVMGRVVRDAQPTWKTSNPDVAYPEPRSIAECMSHMPAARIWPAP